MMTGHKKAIRVNDQYHCAECGRQWDLDDVDQKVTSCKRESRAGREAVDSMRKDPLHGKK